jgi:hypothetical protein
MTAPSLQELLRRQPFRPFRVVMADGAAYPVTRPDRAFVTSDAILVGVGESRHGVPSSFQICSLRHVTAVEPLAATPNAAADA